MTDKKTPGDPGDTEVFRSPSATIIWWVWILFALGNLIDLAVQGRDHLSLVAAFTLVFVTGIVYVTARRPRVVADPTGLTIANPVRYHHIGWLAVAGADTTDLLRVRCEWPDGDDTRQRAIYCWAVHTSRRRQVATEMRLRRQGQSGGAGRAALPAIGTMGYGVGGFLFGGIGGLGTTDSAPAPGGDPLRLDANQVVSALTERAEQARRDEPEAQAQPPLSTWDLTALAALAVPALALVLVALL